MEQFPPIYGPRNRSRIFSFKVASPLIHSSIRFGWPGECPPRWPGCPEAVMGLLCLKALGAALWPCSMTPRSSSWNTTFLRLYMTPLPSQNFPEPLKLLSKALASLLPCDSMEPSGHLPAGPSHCARGWQVTHHIQAPTAPGHRTCPSSTWPQCFMFSVSIFLCHVAFWKFAVIHSQNI